MIGKFSDNRKYLDNEFEYPQWNRNSGLDAPQLSADLKAFIDDHLNLPMPLLRARAFEWLLTNVQIEINPRNIFADKINIGVDYGKFAGQDIFAKNMYMRFNTEIQEREIPEEYRRNKQAGDIGIGTAWADYWHTVPDWNDVLHLGFPGLLDRACREKAEKASSGELSAGQEIFYDSVIISYRAILKFIRRLYEESLNYDIPQYSACLNHIISHPPETMYEVLETVYLFLTVEEIGVERGRSLGIIDKLYYPFFREDLKSGRFTIEDIREMFRYLFNKFNAAKRFAAQPLTLCAINPDDEDAENELTTLILDVYEELGHLNPKIQIRYRPKLPDGRMEKVMRLIRSGQNSILMINDEAVFKGYEKIGIPRDVSASYVPIGCYEPIIMGREDPMLCACWLNIVKAVEFAVTGGKDLLTGAVFGFETPRDIESFNEYMEAFYGHLDYLVEFMADNIDRQTELCMKINPSPVLSGSMRSCMERGRDIFDGGMEYSNTTMKFFGLATAVDSILAVKRLVFDERRMTFPELREAMENNWRGYEKIRLLIRRDHNKYGNNLSGPDSLMCDIVDHLSERIVNRINARGGVYRMGSDSIDHAVYDGEKTGATPDGRYAGDPISKNLCASAGMERGGVTAFMQSVLKLDHSSLLGAEPLDYLVHPSAVQGEAGIRAMVSMFRKYFEQGGVALQGNVLNAESLMEAQVNPEKYRHLQVRLCGWNEYFINLSATQQNEFIKQTMKL